MAPLITESYLQKANVLRYFKTRPRFFLVILASFLILCFNLVYAWAKLTNVVPRVAPGAVSIAPSLFHEEFSEGTRLIFKDQYEKGLSHFDALRERIPEHPAPYFFKAAAYQSWMSTFRNGKFQESMEENVRLAIEKGTTLLVTDKDPWNHFFVGAAFGYRAFNRFSKHDWIGAYFDAIKGIKNFEEALKQEPRIYDAYLGLGTYHYWRTAKSSFIRLIAFWMADRRELGLRQLDFSRRHGLYSPHEATYNLIAACFDYGKYQQAFDILNEVLKKKKKPGLSDLYYRGRLLAKFNRWHDVEVTFRGLSRRLEKHPLASTGYKVEIRYWIALALRKQNKISGAWRLTEDALILSAARNGHQELEGPFESFMEIKNELAALHTELKIEKQGLIEALEGQPDRQEGGP